METLYLLYLMVSVVLPRKDENKKLLLKEKDEWRWQQSYKDGVGDVGRQETTFDFFFSSVHGSHSHVWWNR